MINTIHLEQLLSNTKRIIAHQKELEKIRGENFNIFSVLGLQRNENRTHSAFLGELLNPKGSHQKGDIFLKLFLSCFEIDHVDIDSLELYLEYSIGGRNDTLKQGGRIDIFIHDKHYNSISIENKIDAIDQNTQVERYCNYNKGKNKVFYLTLDGKEPSKESKGNLESGNDFILSSYEEDIVHWLELCLKESAETPILRETIKQYILLIKKLTQTMDNQSEKELIDIMFKYYEEAMFINSNFDKVRQNIGEEIRQQVISILKEQQGEQFDIIAGASTSRDYSQIWIKLKEFPNSSLYFGIESFSGKGWFNGDLFIGIFNEGEAKSKINEMHNNSNASKWWADQYPLSDLENCKMNIGNVNTLNKLRSESNFKDKFIAHIVNETTAYLNKKAPQVISFLTSENNY